MDLRKKYDCGNNICRNFYGKRKKQLWCEVCTSLSSYIKRKSNVENKPKNLIPKKSELCPDCGKNVKNMKLHYKTTHEKKSETCPHCDEKVSSLSYHVRYFHEKIPCKDCGEMVIKGREGYHRALSCFPLTI